MKQLNETTLEALYQKNLKRGYYPLWAEVKAKNELLEIEHRELMESLTIDVPGVGNCQYTGD